MNKKICTKYARGTMGSFILVCPKCNRERFRQKVPNIAWEKCFDCGSQLEFLMEDADDEQKDLH